MHILAVAFLVFYVVATFLGIVVEYISNLPIENFINNIILPFASHPKTLILTIVLGIFHTLYSKDKKLIGIILIIYCGLILLSHGFVTWFVSSILRS